MTDSDIFTENVKMGRGNIWAEIIADSVNNEGSRLTTFRLHYPRFIHSEFMTHRMFSRNASSSRAIPVQKMISQISESPAKPIHWGANKPGMTADSESDELIRDDLGHHHRKEAYWQEAADEACRYAMGFSQAGYHKQIVNRITEPFQFMNVVATATDFDNFFFLRYHEDAQPEICELAKVMYEAYIDSEPELLQYGEWHTPYVEHERRGDSLLYVSAGDYIPWQDALKISASCCAQASYRKLDTSLDKAFDIYDRLVESKPVHASPFEHIATPFSDDETKSRQKLKRQMELLGIEGFDQVLYNANFKGWNQYRKKIPGETFSEIFKKKVDTQDNL